jgi:hypothetical protein
MWVTYSKHNNNPEKVYFTLVKLLENCYLILWEIYVHHLFILFILRMRNACWRVKPEIWASFLWKNPRGAHTKALSCINDSRSEWASKDFILLLAE